MVTIKTFKEVVILVGAAIILALTVNYFSPVGIALVGQWDTSQGVVTAREKNNVVADDLEIGDVTLAKEMYDSGKFVFVDARSREDYSEGHIKGALSLPVGEFYDAVETFMNQVALEESVITYCSGRTCEDSHQLAQLLLEIGYEKVNVFIDGYPAWKAGGHPIEQTD